MTIGTFISARLRPQVHHLPTPNPVYGTFSSKEGGSDGKEGGSDGQECAINASPAGSPELLLKVA